MIYQPSNREPWREREMFPTGNSLVCCGIAMERGFEHEKMVNYGCRACGERRVFKCPGAGIIKQWERWELDETRKAFTSRHIGDHERICRTATFDPYQPGAFIFYTDAGMLVVTSDEKARGG